LLIIFPLACIVLAFIQNKGLSEIIQPGAKLEKLAEGFLFTEGPAADAKVNACFGGEDMKSLFITANKSLYRIRTKIKGAY
jgi:formate dehydrogenase assembly factor FdhD